MNNAGCDLRLVERVIQVINRMQTDGVIENYAIGGGHREGSSRYLWKNPTNIFTVEYLAAELLPSGRRKDHARVIALIEGSRVDMTIFRNIVNRYSLSEKWESFAKQFDFEH